MAYSQVEKLLHTLKADDTGPCRFPVRYILVDDLENWQELLSKIKNLVDRTVRLSDLCKGQDVLPDLDHLTSILRQDREHNFLVFPLAEYFRFSEDGRRYLVELSAIEEPGTKRRIYVPLFDISDVFFLEMNRVSRFVDNESCKHYVLQSDNDKKQNGVRVTVVMDKADLSALESSVYQGLKAYFRLWENGGKDKIVLMTQFAAYFKDVYGSFSLSVLKNSFEVLMHYLRGPKLLNKEDATADLWDELLRTFRRGDTIHDVFHRVFKVMDLEPGLLFPQWKNYSTFQRWLLWIWCRTDLHAGYLRYIFSHNNSFLSLEEDIINGVFEIPTLPAEEELAWLRERKKVLQDQGIASMPASFWYRANTITDSIELLKTLSGISHEEKRKVVIAVRKLLEVGVRPEKWLGYLEIIYPELAWYLDNVFVDDELLYRYFGEYLRAKLMDRVTDEIVKLSREACRNGGHYLWKIPARKNILEQVKLKTSRIYWVDGLGVEWLGLITGLIKNLYQDVAVDYRITRANLPTTTEYNCGWEDDNDYQGFKGLDELVHSYTCEYPGYIIEEIEIVEKIVQDAITLLNYNDSVVITSDHGTSRLAAIHQGKSVPPPAEAVAEKFGRYCVCSDAYNMARDYDECLPCDDKLVFATHRRFTMSGNMQGEIHGGATLEEALVPVILLRKVDVTEQQARIAFELLTPQLKLDARKIALLKVAVQKQIEKLILVVSGKIFEGKLIKDRWEFSVSGLSPARYKGKLYAKSELLGEVEFELQLRGLVENKMEI